MRFRVGSVCLFIFCLTNASGLIAAENNISVKVEVDKAFATIGDEINFRVTAEHRPDITILEIEAEKVLSDFEIKKTTNFSTREGGATREGKNYVLTSYLLGEYVIHPFPITYRTKDGSVKEIQTNSLYITMESVDKNKNPESDIRGVKGVYQLNNPIIRWILGFLFLSGAGGFGIWFYQRQKKRAPGSAEREPVLSPHEEAYLALNQLKHSDLIRKGLVKQYFFQMSEILRRYVERRFRTKALESTTYELLRDLKPIVETDHLQLINDVLTFCDLVKFAKYNPTPLEIIQESNQAKVIVDTTKEEPAPVLPENIKTI